MKKKDVLLFDKTIHEVKRVVAEIKEEREDHYNKYKALQKAHDRKTKKMMKELISVVDDLYELFTDLSNGGENGKQKT